MKVLIQLGKTDSWLKKRCLKGQGALLHEGVPNRFAKFKVKCPAVGPMGPPVFGMEV